MGEIKRLVLLGFMGAGKSTVGQLLASACNYEWIDVDHEVLRLSGCSSVTEIFDKLGEAGFRKLEARAFARCRSGSRVVISTGGGIVTNPHASKELAATAADDGVVYLQVSFETVLKRVGRLSDRPLLKDAEKAKGLLESRVKFYQQYSNYEVKTDGLPTDEVVAAIHNHYQGVLSHRG